MTLRGLRNARDLTQECMARLLGVGPENISRLEGRTDRLLFSYLATMGNSLDLIIHVRDRPAVFLSALFGRDEEVKGKSR